MNSDSIIIIGGGITGLSAAWYLEKSGYRNIHLLEASPRLGGKIQTWQEDGFLVEKGADSFITTKPFALTLIEELGMSAELIDPLTNRFYILKDKRLQSVPEGFRMMTPTRLKTFLDSRLFSWSGKHRVLAESRIPARQNQEDESFESFVTRRLGKEMLDNYAEPLFGGIYATPSAELSMQAAFPQFVKAESRYGSLAHAVARQPMPQGSHSRSPFQSLRGGMQSLVDTLAGRLQYTRKQCNTTVQRIEHQHDHKGYTVYASNEALHADKIICTLPASVAGQLLRTVSLPASYVLGEFTVSSSYIVNMAIAEDHLPARLVGTGYVVARSEKTPVTAGTWSSAKWQHRAPEGYELVRCFFSHPEEKYTEGQLLQMATAEMQRLIGMQGEPYKYWVSKYEQALPQYKTGHLERVSRLREAMRSLPGFYIAGAYVDGVGVPDCIKQGRIAAESILNNL